MKALEIIKDYRNRRKKLFALVQNCNLLQEQSVTSRARFMKKHEALSTLELPLEAITASEAEKKMQNREREKSTTNGTFDEKKWAAKGSGQDLLLKK